MRSKCLALAFGALLAMPALWGQDIVLVRCKTADSAAQREYDRFLSTFRKRLDVLGIASKTIADDEVAGKGLGTAKMVVFPYNPRIPEATQTAVATYVNQGGKLALFYSSAMRLLALLGIESVPYIGAKDLPSLRGIRFDRDILPQAPELLVQASHNIMEPTLKVGGGGQIVGEWIGQDGKAANRRAAVLHPNGFYLSHVYLDQDARSGGRFLQALLGHFLPELWPVLATRKLESIGQIAGMESLQQLTERVRKFELPAANAQLDRARQLRDQAQSALNQRQYAASIDWSEQAAAAAGEAFLMTCPSRSGELRGAWFHTPYGVEDWGWDKSIKALAENGFNAIFPNFCWGYVADYPSDVLPMHPNVATRGDMLQECLDACRKYGVEIHVWKVNWNMGSRTPEELREKMREAGRTQMTVKGEPTRYLAPHRQDNFELERDAMLELVRKYPIDGIHFDYIRYPDSGCDFSPGAREAFEAVLGRKVEEWPKDCAWGGKLRKEYNAWRQGNISRLVEAVYHGAKAIRADIKVSAAVFSDWESAEESIAQAAGTWIDKGWLDFVCPMNYTTDYAALKRRVEYQVQRVNGRIPLYSGLGTYLHDGPVMTGSQVELSRALGADGVVCFDLRRSLVEEILPVLGKNVFASAAGPILPHHVAVPTFTAAPGRPDLEHGYVVGDTLSIKVTLPPAIAKSRDLQARFSCDGRLVDLGKGLKMRRRGRMLEFSGAAKEAGRYRLELSSPNQDFLARSPVCRVYDETEAADLRLRHGPPVFSRKGGLRVGVWQDDAYGAPQLLQALQQTSGVDAQPLLNLKASSLAACQVVILPQPRRQQPLFKSAETAAVLNAYVKQGGGLLVTHALVGIRGLVNPVPEVVASADENALPGSEWKVSGGHAVTAGIGRQVQVSTFGDRIKVTPARGGTVVATTDQGESIMVVGAYGRGRYAACGLGLAIGKDDKDCQLSPAELMLLQNTVKWLAK